MGEGVYGAAVVLSAVTMCMIQGLLLIYGIRTYHVDWKLSVIAQLETFETIVPRAHPLH